MSAFPNSEPWQETLRRRLSFFGHRNWIVVADAAYPQQASPGLESILADGKVASAVTTVLDAVRQRARPSDHLPRCELAVLSARRHEAAAKLLAFPFLPL